MHLPATILRIFSAFALLAGSHANASGIELELPAVRAEALRGNVKAVEAARTRFAGHPLEAYPQFWLLAAHPARATDDEMRGFLARYADTPLAEALRREWLKALGAAGSWELFRAEHPKLVADDPEVACYSFQERLARADAEVAAEARSWFVSGREAPAACEPVFTALGAAAAIGEADALARMRKLLAANQLREAKRANQLLAPRRRLDEKLLDRAAANPSAFLASEKSAVLSHTARELVLYAVGRLARSKPDEAAERLAQFASRLDGDAARHAWGVVAWQAATSHHPQALEWYGNAHDAPLTEAQLAWKARAALRAGAWKEVLAAIQQLPPEEAREASWRYWRARALRELGAAEASLALLRGLAAQRNFYGILAAEELDAVQAPQWDGWKPQAEDLERARALPALQRALALYRAGLDAEALREWFWAIRGMDDRNLLAAAELARLAGVPDRAINTANRTVQLHDLEQRFPTPHREAVSAAARRWSLDEALAYSIIRQESRFMPHARSRVGATGLMQLMPATARWVARQIPVQPYRQEMLVEPAINVKMGTYYFSRVLGDLGHTVLATAAYNAGPGRARRWRGAEPLEGAIYVESIPFNETRDYVKQVLVNAWFYSHRLTGAAPSLRDLVGTIPGRAGAAAALASNIP